MSAGTDRLERMMSGTHIPSPCGKALHLPGLDGYEKGKIWYDWRVDADFVNVFGALSGGYICALMDDAAALAAITLLPDEVHCLTSDIRVSFFRPCKPSDWLRMEATVINASRSSYHIECSLLRKEDGKLVAKATAVLPLIAKFAGKSL